MQYSYISSVEFRFCYSLRFPRALKMPLIDCVCLLTEPQFPERPNQHNHFPFGIAIEDYNATGTDRLTLWRGMLVEDISYMPNGVALGRYRGRRGILVSNLYFSSIPQKLTREYLKGKDQIVLVLSDVHKAKLLPFSSQELYDKAVHYSETRLDQKPRRVSSGSTQKVQAPNLESRQSPLAPNTTTTIVGDEITTVLPIVYRLFAMSDEMKASNQRQPMYSRGYPYVDGQGQLFNDALHVAVLNQDHDLVGFLLEHTGKPNEICEFLGLHLIEVDNTYTFREEIFTGTPLKAAAHVYVYLIHHYPKHEVEEAARPWQKIIQLLIENGASWAQFADGMTLLGPLSHMRADAQSMLERSMDYNDSWTFKSVIEAVAGSDDPSDRVAIEWLPCSHFFDFSHYVGLNKLSVKRLSQTETQWALRILLEQAENYGEDDELRHSVPRILWQYLPGMDMSPALMAELLDQVMSSIAVQQPVKVASNLAHLLQCRHPKPDLRKWAQRKPCASILHYVAEKDCIEVMRTLLELGHYSAISKESCDRETPFDIAKRIGNVEMQELIQEYGGDEGHSSYAPSEPGPCPIPPDHPSTPGPGGASWKHRNVIEWISNDTTPGSNSGHLQGHTPSIGETDLGERRQSWFDLIPGIHMIRGTGSPMSEPVQPGGILNEFAPVTRARQLAELKGSSPSFKPAAVRDLSEKPANPRRQSSLDSQRLLTRTNTLRAIVDPSQHNKYSEPESTLRSTGSSINGDVDLSASTMTQVTELLAPNGTEPPAQQPPPPSFPPPKAMDWASTAALASGTPNPPKPTGNFRVVEFPPAVPRAGPMELFRLRPERAASFSSQTGHQSQRTASMPVARTRVPPSTPADSGRHLRPPRQQREASHHRNQHQQPQTQRSTQGIWGKWKPGML